MPTEGDLEKGSRLDVLATLGTKERVDIEIQLSRAGSVCNRSLFYGSRLIGNQPILGIL